MRMLETVSFQHARTESTSPATATSSELAKRGISFGHLEEGAQKTCMSRDSDKRGPSLPCGKSVSIGFFGKYRNKPLATCRRKKRFVFDLLEKYGKQIENISVLRIFENYERQMNPGDRRDRDQRGHISPIRAYMRIRALRRTRARAFRFHFLTFVFTFGLSFLFRFFASLFLCF